MDILNNSKTKKVLVISLFFVLLFAIIGLFVKVSPFKNLASLVNYNLPENKTYGITGTSVISGNSVTRVLPPNYIINRAIVITLKTNMASSVKALGIREYVPEGWKIISVSQGGIEKSGNIEWLFMPANGVKFLTYKIKPTTSSGTFSGIWETTDLVQNPITGPNEIQAWIGPL